MWRCIVQPSLPPALWFISQKREERPFLVGKRSFVRLRRTTEKGILLHRARKQFSITEALW